MIRCLETQALAVLRLRVRTRKRQSNQSGQARRFSETMSGDWACRITDSACAGGASLAVARFGCLSWTKRADEQWQEEAGGCRVSHARVQILIQWDPRCGCLGNRLNGEQTAAFGPKLRSPILQSIENIRRTF